MTPGISAHQPEPMALAMVAASSSTDPVASPNRAGGASTPYEARAMTASSGELVQRKVVPVRPIGADVPGADPLEDLVRIFGRADAPGRAHHEALGAGRRALRRPGGARLGEAAAAIEHRHHGQLQP